MAQNHIQEAIMGPNQGIGNICPAGFRIAITVTAVYLPFPPSLNSYVHINHPVQVSPLYVGCGRQMTCSLVHRSSGQKERYSKSYTQGILFGSFHLYMVL